MTEATSVALRFACWRAGWTVLLFLALNAGIVAAVSADVLLEIRSEGGYRDPTAPDPFVTLRVHSNGRAGCHCPDYQWAEGQFTAPELEKLRQLVAQSGFFSLKGGASRWSAWWHKRQSDAGIWVYFAHMDGKKKTYRDVNPFEPKPPEPLRRLREATQPFRERLCALVPQASRTPS